MNKQIKAIFVLALSLVMSVTSCLNEVSDPNGGGNALPGNVESLDSQVAAMKISVGNLESVSGALVGVAETLDVDALKAELESCSALVQDHIASVENGAQAVASTVKAIELQGRIAETVGALKAQVELLEANGQTRVLLERIQTLEEGVASWLGDKFENYYLVSSDLERVNEFSSVAKEQALSVDALQSDVEAGLRKDDQSGDLAKVASSVSESAKLLAEQQSSLSALASELETGYVSAIKSSTSESKSTLKALNTKAAAARTAADNTLEGLIERVAVCEGMIEDLYTRLEQLNARVDELLRMIQSLTFVSEYSEDYAVAKYGLILDELDSERRSEGKCKRVPADQFQLIYMVRPASAAQALVNEGLWNNQVSVKGYYAQKMQLSSADVELFDFVIEDVKADDNGLLTLTLTNSFSSAFYFKEIGAKVALSVVSGQTDCMSKFIEIVPKDDSDKVYAESIVLDPTSVSIQDGETCQLSAVVTPSNVTDKGVVWSIEGSSYVDVDSNGLITGTGVGKTSVIVTANATDEFGRTLKAKCDVDVTPSVKIKGPDYVEYGKTEVLTLESPMYISPSDVRWEIGTYFGGSYIELNKNNDGSCSVTSKMIYHDSDRIQQENGTVLVTKAYYKPITVKCIIEADPVMTISHELRSVEVQPKAIIFDGIQNNENTKVLKIREKYNLNGTMEPENVDTDCFKIVYQSNQTYYATVDFDLGVVDAVGVGTAYVDAVVYNKQTENYLYPSDRVLRRTIAIQVDPYFIKEITLPEAIELEPEETGTLTATLTSDSADGLPPTYTDIIWSSSDPNVLYIDPETGDYEARAIGSVTITATAPEHALPAGESLSATCGVTVLKKEYAPKVGDFLYKDGTWSSTYTNDVSNPVIGVVFKVGNVTLSDTKLAVAAPNAINGLAVSVSEYNHSMGYIYLSPSSGNPGEYLCRDRSYEIYRTDIPNGFANTQGWMMFANDKRNDTYDGKYYYAALFRPGTGVIDLHTSNVTPPANASTWYVPSYCEMKELKANIVAINNSMDEVGGALIHQNANYWMSSFRVSSDQWKDITSCAPFNMAAKDGEGDWGTQPGTGADLYGTTYPVRVVLAF